MRKKNMCERCGLRKKLVPKIVIGSKEVCARCQRRYENGKVQS